MHSRCIPSKDARPGMGGWATLQLAPARCLGRCGGRRKRALRQTCSREDPENAICVQRLDDSLNSAIRTRYRILLRSSSMHKPRDPPLEVVNGSIRPLQAASQGTTHDCHGLTGKRQRPETLGRDSARVRHARWRTRELGRAPQGRAGDRIPTQVGTPSAAASAHGGAVVR